MLKFSLPHTRPFKSLTMALMGGLIGSFSLLTIALAQNAYPDKQIRLVVGFSAGGPTDIPARFIAEHLTASLGKKVVVENKTGAGGQIATQDVLSKPKDGYNLLLCTHFESINAAVYRNLNYKLSDIAPITQISRYYYAVVLTSELPPNQWEGFVAYAKANPGKLNYGMIGRGSAQELLALELGKFAGIQMVGVPYKGGTEMMGDLLAGRVQMYVSPTGPIIPLVKNGKLKVLAVSSPERLSVLPDTPTMQEKGIPFVRFGWLGICAANGTPTGIINQLNHAITEVVQMPEYKELIEKAGSIPLASKPEELSKIMMDTYDQTLKVVNDYGLNVSQ
jgi:tripartite-type tricarboxylate transporter receptor subunit TctC